MPQPLCASVSHQQIEKIIASNPEGCCKDRKLIHACTTHRKYSKMFIIVVFMNTIIFHKKHVFGARTMPPPKPYNREAYGACLTPELFSLEERGCPDKEGRDFAPDAGSPPPPSLRHGSLTSPQPRGKGRLSSSPARPLSARERWRPGGLS